MTRLSISTTVVPDSSIPRHHLFHSRKMLETASFIDETSPMASIPTERVSGKKLALQAGEVGKLSKWLARPKISLTWSLVGKV